MEQLPAVLYIAEVGMLGRWRYVSPWIQALLGFSADEWQADPGLWAARMHPDDRRRISGHETELAQAEVPDEYRMHRRDGSTVWVRDEAALVEAPDGELVWHGVLLDITDRKLAELEAERRAEQQAAVARLGRDALEGKEVTSLMKDALAEATRIVGASRGAVFEVGTDGRLALHVGIGLSGGELAAPVSSDADPSQPALDDIEGLHSPDLPVALPLGITGEIEGRTGRWGVVWLEPSCEHAAGAGERDFVQALANILAVAIQRLSSEEEIRYQALHDPLTGLPNRVLFLDCLARALERPSAHVALVEMDIDNFKLVNDSLGHGAGDKLLMQVAPRLREALRPNDVIGRLGGDEFVVLLDRVQGARAARRVAERIVAAFEEPFKLGAGEHFAKASLGIAIARDEGCSPASLLRDADAALYEAKRRGRARFEIFDRAMRARTIERLSLENELSRALEREELRVVYQPIVSLHDLSLHSLEALLRWEHPERGEVMPGSFIPIAEESGMIEPIGRWVLETACMQVARWRSRSSASGLGLSVNVSLRQFAQGDLEGAVRTALERSGLDPAGLRLEITESVLAEEPQWTSERISRISRLGTSFVLDDFGTGYSSLAYVGGLPISGLKVDRSFVQMLEADPRARAITSAIVRMAQALELEVTAEGVEEEQQLAALREMGCELAQGFLFHRPMSAQQVERLLSLGAAKTTGDVHRRSAIPSAGAHAHHAR